MYSSMLHARCTCTYTTAWSLVIDRRAYLFGADSLVSDISLCDSGTTPGKLNEGIKCHSHQNDKDTMQENESTKRYVFSYMSKCMGRLLKTLQFNTDPKYANTRSEMATFVGRP